MTHHHHEAPLQFVPFGPPAIFILPEETFEAFDDSILPTVPRAPPRRDANQPQRIPSPDPYAAPPPLPGVDKRAKSDKEHGIVRYNEKLRALKELNEAAFENDTPWANRPSRANVGYSAMKFKLWR